LLASASRLGDFAPQGVLMRAQTAMRMFKVHLHNAAIINIINGAALKKFASVRTVYTLLCPDRRFLGSRTFHDVVALHPWSYANDKISVQHPQISLLLLYRSIATALIKKALLRGPKKCEMTHFFLFALNLNRIFHVDCRL
jgi:hypothetical protein